MALDPTALFTLSYGLYVLTAREGGRDLGCIVNTDTQLTENLYKSAKELLDRSKTDDNL